MRKKIAIGLVISFLLLGAPPVQAIEGGTDATGDAYVIPIYNEDAGTTCSGALIASKIIVTVAHCIMGKDGLISGKVWVGTQGGSGDTALMKRNFVESQELSSSYSESSNQKVVDDDIAFLIPKYEIYQKNYVHLASSAENARLKAQGVSLRVSGYGDTDNLISNGFKTPNTFVGTYITKTSSIYPNSGFLKSTVGRSCKGDSGGPVFYVSVSRTVLVGVTSGVLSDVNCAKKDADGSYELMFTEISKYANLAFDASSVAASSTVLTVNAEYAKDDAKIAGLDSAIYESQNENVDLVNENTKLKACLIAAKKIMKTKKGKLAKNC